MTSTSALTGPHVLEYMRGHAKVMRFLGDYYGKLIDGAFLEDLDEYVTRVVSPAFGRTVEPQLFDHALTAYGCVQAVQDGTHEDLNRNPSGVVDNTLWLLDRETEYLDMQVRFLLNSIGIS